MDIYDYLTDEKSREINEKIPKINSWIKYNVLGTSVNDFINGTQTSAALVCLDDARNRFSFIQTALFEAQAKMAWYLEISPNAPDKFQAIASGKFFLDYVTLLLYAIGEDISFFITNYFNINITDYVKRPEIQVLLEKKKISSNAGKVALYLSKEMQNARITNIVTNLHKTPDWKKALDYRNTWVHDKPPIIGGLGNELPRKIHSITTDANGAKNLEILGGVPQYSIDQLLQIAINASQALSVTLSEIVEMVILENEK